VKGDANHCQDLFTSIGCLACHANLDAKDPMDDAGRSFGEHWIVVDLMQTKGLSADDAKPSTLTWHALTLVVLPRGARYALRVKDADSPTRTEFRGLHWYAADPTYRVTARSWYGRR
jgi:uncharacterized protein (DUF1684 family)